jgi:hypothetical protein
MSGPPPVYWVRVEAPHFVAALKITDERCTEAAPILRWAVGQTAEELRSYFKLRGWQAVRRPTEPKGVAR